MGRIISPISYYVNRKTVICFCFLRKNKINAIILLLLLIVNRPCNRNSVRDNKIIKENKRIIYEKTDFTFLSAVGSRSVTVTGEHGRLFWKKLLQAAMLLSFHRPLHRLLPHRFPSLLRSRPPLPSRSMTLRSWLSGTT